MSTPQKFVCEGPYPLKIHRERNGKCVKDDTFDLFWETRPALAEKAGCYIFCLSRRPIYVGKAAKTFKQEVFTGRNRNIYNQQIVKQNGPATVYFVVLEQKQGRHPINIIAEVEKLLIGLAHEANPDLVNGHHKNKEDRFMIHGVWNAGKGKPSQAAKAVRRVLKMKASR